ncbi:MAG: Dps family protein [Candidatus Binatia bacterium]
MTTMDRSRSTSEAASRLLADSYAVYLKTHNFHWNVTGPMFTTLHGLFETQYRELAEAVDEIAERIRALGHVAPGSYSELSRLSKVKDAAGASPAEHMIRELLADHALVRETAAELFAAAEAADDPASADLAVRRIDASEKAAWMLRSHLE